MRNETIKDTEEYGFRMVYSTGSLAFRNNACLLDGGRLDGFWFGSNRSIDICSLSFPEAWFRRNCNAIVDY